MSRRKKIDNPDLIPRKPEDLPDLEKVTAEYEPIIRKICHDIRKNFYRQVHIPEMVSEIYQEVMLNYYEMWNWYKAGAIDNFPPPAGYLYSNSWRRFTDRWAPQDDLYNCGLLAYNSIEVPVDVTFTGNLIIVDPLYKEIATQEQQLPYTVHQDEEDEIFGTSPDLLDFWYLGFSINELGVIYNLHPNTIRLRLHNYYDAIEMIHRKPFRPRPHRRKRTINRFKKRKNR